IGLRRVDYLGPESSPTHPAPTNTERWESLASDAADLSSECGESVACPPPRPLPFFWQWPEKWRADSSLETPRLSHAQRPFGSPFQSSDHQTGSRQNAPLRRRLSLAANSLG